MSYNVYIIDTETTGLDPKENDVIEVSLWRSSDDQQKTWCLKPLNTAIILNGIADKALKVNGHKKENILHKTAIGIETYLEPSDAVYEIEAWTITDGCTQEERVFTGHNSLFDFNFLQELWKKAGTPDTFPFGTFRLDTMDITRLIDLCTGKKRSRYNLGSLVKDFSITKTKAHRAEGDVKMTRDLFLAQFNPIKDHIASIFEKSYSDEDSI